MTTKYFRHFKGDDIENTQELSEEEWLRIAEDNVYYVGRAKVQGFQTGNARYWTEEEGG